MNQHADHLAERLVDPSIRIRLRAAGLNVDDWDDFELATLAFTVKAVGSGGQVFVPAAMEPLVCALIRGQEAPKTAATPLRR